MLNVHLASMSRQDADLISALDSSLNPFAWSAQNFIDSLNARHSAWLLKQNSNIIGFAVWMLVLDEAHILNIGIAKTHQRQGLGAYLLNEICKQSYALGAMRLFLEVRVSNTPALSLYHHFGFKEIARRKNYYQSSNGNEDALILLRLLPLAEHNA